MPAFDPSVDPFAPSEQAQETPSSQLDETLAQLLTSYNLLANAVGNVQVDGLVGDTVTRVVSQLAELQHQASSLNHVLIPMPVIELVDQGKNPDMYNRSFIDRTAAENQFTNGIFEAVKEYRDDYAREVAVAFPALADSLDTQQSNAALEDQNVFYSILQDRLLPKHSPRPTRYQAELSTVERHIWKVSQQKASPHFQTNHHLATNFGDASCTSSSTMADLDPPTYEKTVISTNEIGSGQTSQAGDAITTAPTDVSHPPANDIPASTTAQESKKSITSAAASESIFPARAPLQTHKDDSLKENYAIDLPKKAVGTQNDVDFQIDYGNIQTKLYLSGRTNGVVRVDLLACRGSVDLALHMDLGPPDLSLRLDCTALKGNTVLLPDHFRGTISFSSALDISCLSPILRQTVVYCPHPEVTRKDLKLTTVEVQGGGKDVAVIYSSFIEGARKTKIALLGESSQQEERQEVKPAVQESQCCCIS